MVTFIPKRRNSNLLCTRLLVEDFFPWASKEAEFVFSYPTNGSSVILSSLCCYSSQLMTFTEVYLQVSLLCRTPGKWSIKPCKVGRTKIIRWCDPDVPDGRVFHSNWVLASCNEGHGILYLQCRLNAFRTLVKEAQELTAPSFSTC